MGRPGKHPADGLFEYDSADQHLIDSRNWFFSDNGYIRAGRPINGERLLHRILLNANANEEVDHRDQNPRNNKRSNLRIATRKEQGDNRGHFKNNTSGYKGVSFHRGRWQASYRDNGKLIYIGRFDTPEEAHAAYLARKGE